MFKSPNTNPNFEPAAFNPNLRPSVVICELSLVTGDCIAGPAFKTFGPSEIAVSRTDQMYQVNWKTDTPPLELAKFYRIQVFVSGQRLGFADVDPVASLNGKQLQNAQTGEYIPLVDGRTLPIKFRIESGALCAVDNTPCTSSTINLNTGGTIELVAVGPTLNEDFKFDIKPGTTASFEGQPVTNVTFNLEVCTGLDNFDLPTVGPCLQVKTYFDGGGPATGELSFTKPLLVSMCVTNSAYHTPDETRQEDLVTLHQQDGSLIVALPHAIPNCTAGTIGNAGGWNWLRQLAARLLMPKPAYAASRNTRTAVLHVGAGGETSSTGSSCTPPPSSPTRTPGLDLSTTCPPSSPTVPGAGPQRAALVLLDAPRTLSKFQFALPARMEYINRGDADRTAPPGPLPTGVRIVDWDSAAVAGAHVTFYDSDGGLIGSATSNSDGIAQIDWMIVDGDNVAYVRGRGIAGPNNYGEGEVRPFMPDIDAEGAEQPVALGAFGELRFHVTGVVPAGLRFRDITTGSAFTCGGLASDSSAWCWGQNGVGAAQWGVLGTYNAPETCSNGPFPCSSYPMAVPGGIKFIQLDAGSFHVCGIQVDPQIALFCWGRNDVGQLGNGTTDSSATPVQIDVPGVNFNQVTLGGVFTGHTCALAGNSKAYCWGENGSGQLGQGNTANRSTPGLVPSDSNFTSLSAGSEHTCGLTPGGNLFCWGRNADGELGDGSTTNRTTPVFAASGHQWMSVSAGFRHTCAITFTGDAYCWGLNHVGQLGNGSTGGSSATPTLVTGGHSFFRVDASGYSTCGMTDNLDVYCWGGGGNGELGNGAFADSPTPGLVSGGHQLFLGAHGTGDFHCGMSTEAGGPTYCWGSNNVGQLGNGTHDNHTATPTQVVGPAVVIP